MAVEIEVTRENPTPSVLALVNPNRKPKKGKKHMPRETNAQKIARLEARVQELEDERLDALEALGVEIIDDDEDEDEDFEDEDEDAGNGRGD